MEKLSIFQIAIQNLLTCFGREISNSEYVPDQNNQASNHADEVAYKQVAVKTGREQGEILGSFTSKTNAYETAVFDLS